MSSEWMKVMLDEIARKKREAEETRAEAERRAAAKVTDEPTRAEAERRALRQQEPPDPRAERKDTLAN